MNHLTQIIIYQDYKDSVIGMIMILFMISALVLICIYYIARYLETVYVKLFKKPFFIHFYTTLKQLSENEKRFLVVDPFYKQLDNRRKRYFEHRAARFIETTDFVSRDQLVLNDEIRIQIAALITRLTFGMRQYLLEYLDTIILYPSSFYSVLNKSYHNGEFNPSSKALVLSWEHFQKGVGVENDGLHLGIHELTHAIHINAIKNTDISAEIFYDTFLELENYLSSSEVRNKVIETNLLRVYAYTDKYEFIAVLVEVFMESPQKLKKHLPEIYTYVSRMFNFRYFDD